MFINRTFETHPEQELLLKQLGFYENNGIWSSASTKGGWVSLDESDPADWNWRTIGELVFYVAEKCHRAGRDKGVRDFKRAVVSLFKDAL